MSGSADSLSPYDASPEAALAAVHQHPGTLLLDFDETAYLRNSTEDFLDAASPGLIALLLLRLLDVVKPWRWTGADTRDVWRVRLVSICLPWIWSRWRKRVAELARQNGNHALIEAVKLRQGPTLICTLGFLPVVTPLVESLGLSHLPVIGSRLDTFEDRRRGKVSMTLEAIDAEQLAASAVLTDSMDDAPLLQRCALPLRTVWPGARYRKALSRVYLPGQYLTQVKRPGQRYVLRGILQEDFAFWVLCSVAYAAIPVLHIFGLLILLLSFWAIYERGYVDNDQVAVSFEKDPKLSTTFWQIEVATPVVQPWIWALISGLAAIWLLRWPGEMTLVDIGSWAAVLIATHFGFKLYNRLDKSSRIWLFPGLQFARTASFVVLVPVGLAASVALGAHVVARWVPYYLYRIGGKDWPEAPFFLSRLLFYILLWLMIALTHDFQEVLTWTALALLIWNVYRARKELVEMIRDIHRIDKPGPKPPQ